MYTKYSEGIIEVITGPMFSGKTTELIRRINILSYSKIKTLVIQPKIGIRECKWNIVSRNGWKKETITIENEKEILTKLNQDNYKAIAIDEAQFFTNNLIPVIEKLAYNGIRVIVSGLDKDANSKPFGPMPQILAIADDVVKLSAICINCGNAGTHTDKIIKNDKLIQIGDKEYQALCRKCFFEKNKKELI